MGWNRKPALFSGGHHALELLDLSRSLRYLEVSEVEFALDTAASAPHCDPQRVSSDETFKAMFVHSPAIINGDTYTVDEAGNPVDGVK